MDQLPNWGPRLAKFALFLVVYFVVTFFIILAIPLQYRMLRLGVTIAILVIGGIIGWSWGRRQR